ncbi:helix-turn-helix transcriptional regulator [Clostridium sp. FP1]|uniref:helix-turn-helix transcriptional regulator n=1 Tax=Clostridium sp. FP1 TaxID=2724076 RepID=UPI0013E98D43|nr:transcriptional regulator [Clostridium sp. FP1]MBZ9633101.1 transcriptional regulator [Clostridium sp. FP1]
MVKNKLLEIRLSLGYKFQKEFAEFLQINHKDYNRIENNNKQVNLETAINIGQKLNMKIEEIWYLEK